MPLLSFEARGLRQVSARLSAMRAREAGRRARGVSIVTRDCQPPAGTIVVGHERVNYLGNGEWQPLNRTPTTRADHRLRRCSARRLTYVHPSKPIRDEPRPQARGRTSRTWCWINPASIRAVLREAESIQAGLREQKPAFAGLFREAHTGFEPVSSESAVPEALRRKLDELRAQSRKGVDGRA
jgi:hypothetical protein